MINKIALLFLILVSQLIIGCGTNNSQNGFENEIMLKHKSIAGELMISSISGLFVMDSIIVVMNPSQGTGDYSLFTFVDPYKNKILGKGGNLGRGPGELLWVKNLSYLEEDKKTFEVFDNIGNSIAGYTIKRNADSIELKLNKQIKVPLELSDSYINEVVKVNNNYIALTLKGKGNYYAFLDSNFNFIKYFGDPPIKENIIGYYRKLQGVMPYYKSYFAYIPFNIPTIQFYSVKDTIAKLEWEDTFSNPYYEVFGTTLRYDKEKTIGHTINSFIDEKYIYIVWWPGKYGDHGKSGGWDETVCSDIIFVYNHKGEKIAKLRLDKKIYSIYISQKHKKIYGIAIDPDFRIVSFDLPKELKIK